MRGLLAKTVGRSVSFFENAYFALSLTDLNLGNITEPINVRRDGTNPATRTFTFIEIINGALSSWVGAGNNGFVVNWYCQLLVLNFNQTDPLKQPIIVDNGILITKNGFPAMRARNKFCFLRASSSLLNPNPLYLFVTYTVGDGGTNGGLVDNTGIMGQGVSWFWLDRLSGGFNDRHGLAANRATNGNLVIADGNLLNINTQYLLTAILDNGLNVYENTTLAKSESMGDVRTSTGDIIIFGYQPELAGKDSMIQQVVGYNTDQSSEVNNIQTKIINDFNIQI